MTTQSGVVLFHSLHALFRLERELRRRGLVVRPVPTPRRLSSDCGSALRFDLGDEEIVRAVIGDTGLEIQGIHPLEE